MVREKCSKLLRRMMRSPSNMSGLVRSTVSTQLSFDRFGAQHQRLKSVDQQLEMRVITRVRMEQAIRPPSRRADVSMGIKHEEAIAVLHRVARTHRRGSYGNPEREAGTAFDFYLF